MEESVTNIAIDRLGKFITLIGGKEGASELSVWNLLELTQEYTTVVEKEGPLAKVNMKPLRSLLLGAIQVHSVI